MRPLIISALAATLIGCTWFAPQQAQKASLMQHSASDTSRTDSNAGAKAEKAPNAKKGHSRHRRKPDKRKIAKANRAPKIDTSSRVQPDDRSGTSINAQTTLAAKTETQQAAQLDDKSSASINVQSIVAAKTDTQQTAQPNDKADPVLDKAMSAIAAKMQNSVSVELIEMKRVEKNGPGKSIDTICGYVRGKSSSGLDTGDRPFLYLVRENEAYIGGYNMATSPYHNLCDK